jgi:N6-adenosine-specific RNA methylase IME4
MRLNNTFPKFKCVVADPPWTPSLHKNTAGRKSPKNGHRKGPQGYYPTMSVEEIIKYKPETDKKAHLYLWVLSQHIDWGYIVARKWGFEPQQMITWAKPTLGTGQFQCNTEHVLVCRKGGPVENAFGKTKGTWFNWKRTRHSEKPDEFFKLVESVSSGPYLEMFARKKRDGWFSWGNEVINDIQIEPSYPLGQSVEPDGCLAATSDSRVVTKDMEPIAPTASSPLR